MPRASARPKVESFNFRVDPELKAAFAAATAEEDRPAGQVLRDFMRGYVARRQGSCPRAWCRKRPPR